MNKGAGWHARAPCMALRLSQAKLRLLLIERGERHEIRATGRTPLKMVNFYAPPAYTADCDERPAGRP